MHIDHLPGKKKDTADALAGVCYFLTHRVNAWQMVGKVRNAGYAAAVLNLYSADRLLQSRLRVWGRMERR